MSDTFLTKTSNALFIFCIILLLYPIITNTWMVTGDGPCHLYNAKILKDLFFGLNIDFYNDFYKLDLSPNPNLWDHLLLAIFQSFLSPSLSEKLFFVLYILTFSFGAKYLCNAIKPNSTWAAIPVLLFTFHHLLMKGFLNYSWSLACSFWVMGFFIKNWQRLSEWKISIQLSILILLNYFMHPIGFVFGLGGIFFSILAILGTQLIKPDARNLVFSYGKKLLPIIPILLPSIIMYINFMSKNNFSKSLDWNSIIKINSLATIVQEELSYSVLVGKLCLLALCLGFVHRIFKGPLIQKVDGILVLCIFFVFLFHANLIDDGMIGGDRLKFLPHICVLFWLTSLRLANWTKMGIMVTGAVFLICFSLVRYPAYSKASAWVNDYLECEKYIEPNTKLLTINYEYNGTTPEGEVIATHNWSFIHGTSYLGAIKPLILADNYQAHMSWFPLNWKDQRFSFYNSTSIDGMSFENRPPRVNITGYPSKSTKTSIEYIMIIGQTPEFRAHQYGQEIEKELNNYNLVCSSVSKKSLLYKLK